MNYSTAQASYPHAPRAASSRAYLELLRVEVTAFHPLHADRLTPAGRCKDSSLWPYSSPYTEANRASAFSGRPLTVTLLYGVRTFLPPVRLHAPASDCLACITGALYRAHGARRKTVAGDCDN